MTYEPGDRVEYIAAPVFDLIITTGEVGIVTYVENGWVAAGTTVDPWTVRRT